MKSINNWKRRVIIITVKHSIVKIVTSFECYYLEKMWNPVQFCYLRSGEEGIQEIKMAFTFILTLREVSYYLEHRS